MRDPVAAPGYTAMAAIFRKASFRVPAGPRAASRGTLLATVRPEAPAPQLGAAGGTTAAVLVRGAAGPMRHQSKTSFTTV